MLFGYYVSRHLEKIFSNGVISFVYSSIFRTSFGIRQVGRDIEGELKVVYR